jgi:uncharacterized phage infection (PIP) family protein YhgE
MTSTPPGMTPQIPAHTQVTPSIPKEPVKPQVSTDTLKRPAQPPEIPAPPIPQPPVTPVAPETKPPIAPKPSETKKTEPDGEQKTPLDIASEKLSWAKDTLDYVGKGLDALKEDNKPGGLSDKGKEALDNIIDILKKFTDKTGEYVEKTKDYVDNSTEYNNKVENLKKNCEKINQNILDLHKKTEDIPMDQRSRAAVSGLIGAVDVTTRAFDAYLRSKGTLGGKIADTLNAPEAGKNTSEALANTIKNITKTKMTLIEEANEGDEVARAILDDGELDKYEEQIERQKEIKKILDEEAAKKEDLKRFHPPPGSVETNYWHPWNWWKVL